MALALTRVRGERVMIDGGRIVLEVAWIDGGKVRLAFDAPIDCVIDREEIHRLRTTVKPGWARSPVLSLTDDRLATLAERLLHSTVDLSAVLPAIHPGARLADVLRRLASIGVAKCPDCGSWRRGEPCPDCPPADADLARQVSSWSNRLADLNAEMGRALRDLDAEPASEVGGAKASIERAMVRLGCLGRRLAEKGHAA
ncbi:carbon storage regulator [Paludisphaera soli]|uniref:carbon storage regulator n=1 Tax=Paludisphaera soli TaxID=2712865 RepID=UPI0013EC34C7|nr:carbon storage regulator [Paludisphaera soli]